MGKWVFSVTFSAVRFGTFHEPAEVVILGTGGQAFQPVASLLMTYSSLLEVVRLATKMAHCDRLR